MRWEQFLLWDTEIKSKPTKKEYHSLTNKHPCGRFVRVAPTLLSLECEAIGECSIYVPEHALHLPGVLQQVFQGMAIGECNGKDGKQVSQGES